MIIDQVPYEAALQTAIANVKNAEAAVATARSRQKAKKNYSKNMLFLILICKRHETVSFRLKQLWHKPKPTKLMPETICHIQRLKSCRWCIGMLPYRVGALVDASISTPLTTVSDDEEMYVYFSMTESQILS